MEETTLNSKIKKFYDVSSGVWERTWGEHMHHGYYGKDSGKNNFQAQVDLIEELLAWGAVKKPASILDVGCGIGGSSIYLAKKFGASVTGITLSPVQAQRAKDRAEKEGLSRSVSFEVEDILSFKRAKGSYDLIWSLESGEHISDKKKFLQVCSEMLAPGGTFLMATWCHRELPPALSDDELHFLKKLYDAYHLPYIVSIHEYAAFAMEAGLTHTETTDWTEEVAPFWNAVKKSVFNLKTIIGVLQAGLPTIRGAIAMNLMIKGYRSGLIRFGLLKGIKA